jgi:quercetin dioxygenase-like cupin family protein
MTWRWLARALFGTFCLAMVCMSACQTQANTTSPTGVTVNRLAQGPVKTLPAGKVYFSILEFRQQPGAEFGPHAHQASIVYTLHGINTVSFAAAASRSVGPGQGLFIPTLAVHTHQNLDRRIGAGAIAVGLIIVVILLCAATWMRDSPRRPTIAVLSIFLIAGGIVPLTGATSNDYYLIAVRPASQRVQPMPRPDGRVVYASPDVDPAPAAPYLETLTAIAVPAGATYKAPDAPGPEMIVVTDGAAAVDIGGETTHLGSGNAAFAQMGQSVSISNQTSSAVFVIDFAVTSSAST